jgi:hypothetical protein
MLLAYTDSLSCLLGFVLGEWFDAVAVTLPGGDYNTRLWIPQGIQAHDEVITLV